MKHTEAIEKKIINLTKEALPDVFAIYLFGSTGTQFENKNSDVDIAILPKQKLTPQQRWELQQKLAISLNKDVDLIDLLQATTILQFKIISTERLLFCRDKNQCDTFEMFAITSYLYLTLFTTHSRRISRS